MIAKILTYNEEIEKEEYTDFYFDENKISAFYLTVDNFVDESVNIIFDGQIITLKREKKLIDLLKYKFDIS